MVKHCKTRRPRRHRGGEGGNSSVVLPRRPPPLIPPRTPPRPTRRPQLVLPKNNNEISINGSESLDTMNNERPSGPLPNNIAFTLNPIKSSDIMNNQRSLSPSIQPTITTPSGKKLREGNSIKFTLGGKIHNGSIKSINKPNEESPLVVTYGDNQSIELSLDKVMGGRRTKRRYRKSKKSQKKNQ